MFEFMEKFPSENKKEYRQRLVRRGTEIINGINCTNEERINVTALHRCQTTIMRLNGKILTGFGITEEEYALKKGTSSDYEAFVQIVYFKHLDLKKFEEEKAKLWDELINVSFQSERERENPTYFEDCLEERLKEDDQYEKQGQKLAYSKIFKVGKK